MKEDSRSLWWKSHAACRTSNFLFEFSEAEISSLFFIESRKVYTGCDRHVIRRDGRFVHGQFKWARLCQKSELIVLIFVSDQVCISIRSLTFKVVRETSGKLLEDGTVRHICRDRVRGRRFATSLCFFLVHFFYFLLEQRRLLRTQTLSKIYDRRDRNDASFRSKVLPSLTIQILCLRALDGGPALNRHGCVRSWWSRNNSRKKIPAAL